MGVVLARVLICQRMSVAFMRGEHDEHLDWPFEDDVMIELVNWREDKNHKKRTLDFSRQNIGSCSRVIY